MRWVTAGGWQQLLVGGLVGGLAVELALAVLAPGGAIGLADIAGWLLAAGGR
ncbi:MAG: hypothetical protein O3A10_08610 [Chloroflexi bacterium]|nr:hypothetical protein [Chloroflexota bacterium]MDA1147335.1 hypothetical protein [Chloroflexota bacterium]